MKIRTVLSSLALGLALAFGVTQAQAALLTDWSYTMNSASLSEFNTDFVTTSGTSMSFESGKHDITIASGLGNTTGSLTFSSDNSTASNTISDPFLSQTVTVDSSATGPSVATPLATLTLSYNAVANENSFATLKVTYTIPLYTYYDASNDTAYVYYNNFEVETSGTTRTTFNNYAYTVGGIALYLGDSPVAATWGPDGNFYSGWVLSDGTVNLSGILSITNTETNPPVDPDPDPPVWPDAPEHPTMDATDGTWQVYSPTEYYYENPTLTNNRTLTGETVYNVNSQFLTAGMFGYHNTGSTNYTFTNNGFITIDTIGSASGSYTSIRNIHGMYANGTGDHTLTNSTDNQINITAKSGEAIASGADSTDTTISHIYGIHAQGTGNHKADNNGLISIDLESGKAQSSAGSSLTTISNIFGILAVGEGDHTLTNGIDGQINITAKSGDATTNTSFGDTSINQIHGMQANANGTGNHKIDNNGLITMDLESGKAQSNDGSSLTAIYSIFGISAAGEGNHTLTNGIDGQINITAKSGDATTDTSFGDTSINQIYGMYANASVNGTVNHKIDNNGLITMELESGKAQSNSERAQSEIYTISGIDIEGVGNHTLTNGIDGRVKITAKSGDVTTTGFASASASASASAFGMHVDGTGTGNHKIINSGLITLEIESGNAESKNGSASSFSSALGVFASGTSLDISNDEAINIISTAGTASTNPESENGHSSVFSDSIGIDAQGTTVNINNNGLIDTISTAGTASGRDAQARAKAIGISSVATSNDNTISNNGIIRVTANGGLATGTGLPNADAFAYGIEVDGNSLVTNTGFIDANATVKTPGAIARAYEAYGSTDFTVDTWATTLRTWSANDTVFGLNYGQKITFANGTSGAHLILRPGTSEEGFALNKEYQVANMVAIADQNGDMQLQEQFEAGKIEGSVASVSKGNNPIIGGVSTEVDFLTAKLSNQDTDNPTVSISINEDMLSTNAAAAQINDALQGQMQNISGQLRNVLVDVYRNANYTSFDDTPEGTGIATGSANAQSQWITFGNLYGAFTDNSKYDIDSDSYGVTAGLSYNFTEQLLAGVHFDFNTTNSEGNTFTNDLDSFAFGLHANYFINNNWYVGANATYAFGTSELSSSQSVGSASDEYSVNAFFAGLSTGYVFEINENNLIIPEIGLSYLYTNAEAYNLNYPQNTLYNLAVDSNSYSALYADLNLKWQGKYELSKGTITPSVNVGIRQNLTGSDIESTFELLSSRFKTEASTDSTTFLTNAGIEWNYNDFSVSVNYDGNFGSEQQSHKASLNFEYKF